MGVGILLAIYYGTISIFFMFGSINTYLNEQNSFIRNASLIVFVVLAIVCALTCIRCIKSVREEIKERKNSKEDKNDKI